MRRGIPEGITLPEAYERYKVGKSLGRSDLFGLIIDEIMGLKARINDVDEAKMKDMADHLSALQRVVGSALQQSVSKGAR